MAWCDCVLAVSTLFVSGLHSCITCVRPSCFAGARISVRSTLQLMLGGLAPGNYCLEVWPPGINVWRFGPRELMFGGLAPGN